MATRTFTEIIDDLDGSADAKTVGFGIDGKTYEIDLSPKNYEALVNAIERYTHVAREESVTRVAAAAKQSNSGKRSDLAAIREWAGQHGFSVSERGRIASDVVAAYDGAH